MPKNTDVCKECGHEYGIHSTDGERCPKNNGQLVNGQLDFYATHFDDGLYGVDQLRAKIDEQAATIARLTADAKLNDMAWNDNQAALKKQAEEIRIIKTAIEDIKIYCNNPSAWDYYDETVSQKIRAILKAAGMA